MNFELSEEQKMIQQSVERFVQDNYDLNTRISLSSDNLGYSNDYWKSMAELGWLGLPFDESDGGFGGNQIDVLVIMEQFGKGLVLEPYLASVVMGGGALKKGGTKSLKNEILPGLIEGTKQLSFAYAEQQSRFDLEDVITSARKEGDGFVLNGQKSMVQHAETADHIIVAARTSGGQIDEDGITVFLVDANSEGLSMDNFPTVDGLRASEITLENVSVSEDRIIGNIDEGFEILQSIANDAILALSAEAVGAMEVLYKDTVEYTQQREQFDHPMSEFQVLQHRMVDMFMEYEQCKSLLYMATMKHDEDSADAKKAISGLKYQVGNASKFIGQQSVQLHGGMGVTDELNVGHYFKRLTTIGTIFGNSDYHLKKYSSL